jgi:hypothetical protein
MIDAKELNAAEKLEIQMQSARFWDARWAIPVISREIGCRIERF